MNLFTVDIDWAPEALIADTLALFEQYGVRCTLFATHKSAVLDACNRGLFEIGLHPNFNLLLDGKTGDPGAIVDELMALYPEARGVRSHSMVQSTRLLNLLCAKGLAYEANSFLPYWPDIRPFKLWNGLLRVPYNWADDIHFMYGRSFDDAGLEPGAALNVLAFHPIHVYLNTERGERYERARAHYHDVSRLQALQNTTGAGTRTLLVRLLERQAASMTLGQFAEGQAAQAT